MATQLTQLTQLTQATQQTQQSTCPSSVEALGPTTYTISGVKVEFPTKAYPSQIAMMSKVIQGLKQNKNCLLESPTGSGKTLALLCASLAWQRHEYARVAEYNAEVDARLEAAVAQLQQQRKQQQDGQLNKGGERKGDLGSSFAENTNQVEGEKEASSIYFQNETAPGQPEVVDIYDSNSDDDFKPTKRPKSAQFDISTTSTSNTSSPALQKAEEVSKPRPNISLGVGEVPYFVPPEKKLTVPKIFFATRTHKQISQITRELRKTFYKTVRSTILASRDHTCINPMLDGIPNKNETCRELLDSASTLGEGCTYHGGARKFGNFNNLENYGVLPGYDLEDFVKAGRVAKACPYYATRFLMANADIIFCPYNYLVDPSIRRSMNLEFENQVIIFDEAHNMEDASREAASFTLKHHEITKAMQDCEKVKNTGGAEPYALGEIAALLSTFCTWIDKQSTKLKDLSYNTSGTFWTGTDIIAALHNSGLDEVNVKKCEDCFKGVLAQREKEMELMKERGLRYQLEKPTITSVSIMIIENVFRLFQDMYKNNGINRDDFRIALIKSVEKRRRDGHTGPFMSFVTLSINVWCLNPAVAFAEIRDAVHSIVLTSGTLSPMHSFESELGTPFPFKLEASHVIDKNQVWAGVVGTGPTGINLNGSFQNGESLSYQDEVGAVVQYVCDTMPHGVLCFFSSYRVMGKLIDRWQITKRYQQLEEKKQVVVEPRSGAADFEMAMNEFYAAVKAYDGDNEAGCTTGGLFFAVCRGKVSEGLDFSDSNARAVICIGIPFPNYQELQVKLKREYNQQNIHRGLLPGGEWYEIQAFRALNQALGRCIRHRQDWGAILLIDDRYIKTSRYIQSLSRWIRSSVRNFENFAPIRNSMESFRDEMLARPIPSEPTFASQTYEGTSFNQAGGGCNNTPEMENASSVQGPPGSKFPDGRQRQPLSTFAGGLSTFDDDDSNDSSTEYHNTRSSFPDSSSKKKGTNRFNNRPNTNKSGGKVQTFQNPGPGIAAFFARQLERNGSSDNNSESNRNKRAREKQLKL